MIRRPMLLLRHKIKISNYATSKVEEMRRSNDEIENRREEAKEDLLHWQDKLDEHKTTNEKENNNER